MRQPNLDQSDVLIVGGYGSVGQRIARLLAPELGTRLKLGGRNGVRANAVATILNASGCEIDVLDGATFAPALDGVGLVVMCIDCTELAFPHACVSLGIHCIDITASVEVLHRLQYLDDLAATQGAAVLCSVGLAPGLTNLMAQDCVQKSRHPISELSILVLLGLGDRHVPAALEWMVDQLHRPFTTPEAPGVSRWSFEERSDAEFPAPFGQRAIYRFNFSDQHTLPRTLGLACVSTWSTFDQYWLATLLWCLAQLRVLRLTQYRPILRAIVWILGKLAFGTDQFAIVVEAVSSSGRAFRCTASGQAEAQGTAVIAAELVRQCLTTQPQPGVAHIDERYRLADFLPVLAAHEINVDSAQREHRQSPD